MEATLVQGEPLMIDYTPGSAVVAGEIIVANGHARIPHADIAADALGAMSAGFGIYDVVKSAVGSVEFADGANVYWSAGTNLATATASDTWLGQAVGASATTDGTVRVITYPTSVTGDSTTVTGAATVGTLVVSDATTPSITLNAGSTNTGFIDIFGKTSGKLRIKTADATAQTVTLTVAAQTSGAATLTIPDMAGAAKTLAWLQSPAFTTPNIGAAAGTSLAATGLITSSSPSAGIGYATGAQGTAVSQATDRTTGVTCSGMSGKITTQATSLAAQTSVAFTVTNTSVAVTDTVIVNIRSGPTGTKTIPSVTTVAAGSFQINLFNTDASVADTGAAIINFAILKAVDGV